VDGSPGRPDRRPTPSRVGQRRRPNAARRGGDRAEMDRPVLVDLAGEARSKRDLQAELVYAAEDQRRVRTDPTITAHDLAAARQRAHATQEVLQEATEHLRASRAGYDAYQRWDMSTGTTRAHGQRAHRELVRRNPGVNAKPGLAQQPTSWVAYPVGVSRPVSGDQGAGLGLSPRGRSTAYPPDPPPHPSDPSWAQASLSPLSVGHCHRSDGLLSKFFGAGTVSRCWQFDAVVPAGPIAGRAKPRLQDIGLEGAPNAVTGGR
jgi:hypothetical protein